MSGTLQHEQWTSGAGHCPTIVATAAINGLGFNPHQIWALARAEQSAFTQSPFICPNGKHATMAHVTSLPPTLQGAERLVALTRGVLEQLVPNPERFAGARRACLYLALPERMADRERATADSMRQRERLVRDVTQSISAWPFPCDVIPCAQGHAAGAFALLEAGRALRHGAIELAFVVGVDGYFDAAVVQQLIDSGRMFDGDNPNAFIGGEGVAACVITTAAMAGSLGWPTLAHVEAVATGCDPATPFNDVPADGAVLAQAARAVLSTLVREQRVLDVWLNDLTGEELRAHEILLALPRFSFDSMKASSRMQHLPEHCGDLGAATLPTAWVLACEMFQRQDGVETCLGTGSTPGGERGAVLLRRPASRGRHLGG